MSIVDLPANGSLPVVPFICETDPVTSICKDLPALTVQRGIGPGQTPVQFSDDAAREMVEEFIQGVGESATAYWTAFFDVRA